MSLYLDSVTLSDGSFDCGTSGVGTLDGHRWSWTPEQAGIYKLNVRAGDQRAVVDIRVAPADAGTGTARKCLFIGDSITEKGGYTGRLLELSGDDGLKIQLLGSRGKAPNSNEGRYGWKAVNYTGFRTYDGMPNKFYNSKSRQFDFKYYMKSMKYASVDRVSIALGTNDVFAFKDDAALNAEIKRVLQRIDGMVKSIHAYDKTIKVGIFITIPPTSVDRYFVACYEKKQTLQRYHRNQFLYTSALVEKFKDHEKSGVYLVPVNAGFDRKNCYGVHPIAEGYDQMGEVVWAWLKNLEAK